MQYTCYISFKNLAFNFRSTYEETFSEHIMRTNEIESNTVITMLKIIDGERRSVEIIPTNNSIITSPDNPIAILDALQPVELEEFSFGLAISLFG